MPEIANAVICPDTGKSLKHQELVTMLRYKIKWIRSTANEICRLYKTNNIRFIHKSDIPKGHKVTHGSFVVDIKEHKKKESIPDSQWEEIKLKMQVTNLLARWD
jgi:CRISPR/Cas system-associated exonuclease Cas4 (RecB family)